MYRSVYGCVSLECFIEPPVGPVELRARPSQHLPKLVLQASVNIRLILTLLV